MKRVKGEGWEYEVPAKGWMIESGKVVELAGDEAFERSRSSEKWSCQVFWTRAAAVERFNEMYDADVCVETPIK